MDLILHKLLLLFGWGLILNDKYAIIFSILTTYFNNFTLKV